VVGVFGLVVVAGEHDRVDVSADVEDAGHGVGGVVPAGDDGPPVEHDAGAVLVAGGGADRRERGVALGDWFDAGVGDA